jgi:transposase-like protein
MEDYPKTILEFRDWFHSEEACRNYLKKLRWPEGFVCPRCGGKRHWKMSKGLFWCRQCHYQVSATAQTLFADSHQPLRLWFEAIWHVTSQKHGVSALGLQKALGLGGYRTAWNWLHKLRRAMVRPGRDRLGGTVQVEEAYVGGEQAGKRGRGAAGKSLVLIAAQAAGKGIGRIRLKRVPNASAASLEAAVKEAIEPGSYVETDGWQGYNDLRRWGYEHRVIRPDAEVGDNLLPLTNRVAALLKRWLLGTHQGGVKATHLDYYLAEFTFRFNRRTARFRGLLFYRLLEQAVHLKPIHGSSLKAAHAQCHPQESSA